MGKSKIRKGIERRVFGKCSTCGRTNTPGHTCRLHFTETNARNVKKRKGL